MFTYLTQLRIVSVDHKMTVPRRAVSQTNVSQTTCDM